MILSVKLVQEDTNVRLASAIIIMLSRGDALSVLTLMSTASTASLRANVCSARTLSITWMILKPASCAM